MRFFIVKDGSFVVGKMAFGGDASAADGMIAEYLTAHPSLRAEEVDQEIFDSTPQDRVAP